MSYNFDGMLNICLLCFSMFQKDSYQYNASDSLMHLYHLLFYRLSTQYSCNQILPSMSCNLDDMLYRFHFHFNMFQKDSYQYNASDSSMHLCHLLFYHFSTDYSYNRILPSMSCNLDDMLYRLHFHFNMFQKDSYQYNASDSSMHLCHLLFYHFSTDYSYNRILPSMSCNLDDMLYRFYFHFNMFQKDSYQYNASDSLMHLCHLLFYHFSTDYSYNQILRSMSCNLDDMLYRLYFHFNMFQKDSYQYNASDSLMHLCHLLFYHFSTDYSYNQILPSMSCNLDDMLYRLHFHFNMFQKDSYQYNVSDFLNHWCHLLFYRLSTEYSCNRILLSKICNFHGKICNKHIRFKKMF